MKKKRYAACYKDKTYYVNAYCEEEVWQTVLAKNGVEVTGENVHHIADSERMVVFLS